MHVVTTRRQYKDRVYETHLLRRSYRENGKVKNETLANLSHLPGEALTAVRSVLRGQTLVGADEAVEVIRSRPHGHVAAVWAQARDLGLPGLLGAPGRARDLVLALVVARVVRPGSKLATTRWWADSTLAEDLGVADAATDEVYAALDWLAGRQESIEAALAARHLGAAANPDRLALYDLSSSWMTGSCCPLAAHGYSRDGKRGHPQIEYGLLTDPAGRPVAVQVFPGNTADPAAFTQAVAAVRDRFGLGELTLVGDRGMITSARIGALREAGGLGWLTALRAPDIAALAADTGPLQLSLFDQTDLAEIASPDYPGERLVACRNPALAEQRARKRAALLAATEAELAKIEAAVQAGQLVDAGAIGRRVGRVENRYKMAKHFILAIAPGSFTSSRDEAAIAAEAALDGVYVLRTSVGAERMDPAAVVRTYKSLAEVERDFRSLKTIDLQLRPIHHYTETRVRAHVFLCLLAAYLTWHLRRTWAPLTFTDQARPGPADPVGPARRSVSAERKAATKTTEDGLPAHSFRSLLEHLATLTRNELRFPAVEGTPTITQLALPTPVQRRAFELLGHPVPLALT